MPRPRQTSITDHDAMMAMAIRHFIHVHLDDILVDYCKLLNVTMSRCLDVVVHSSKYRRKEGRDETVTDLIVVVLEGGGRQSVNFFFFFFVHLLFAQSKSSSSSS